MIEDKVDVSETIRLKHRHLDLRRPAVQQNIMLRHQAAAAVRRTYLNDNGVPGHRNPGADPQYPRRRRDYLVPSRVNPGPVLRPAAVAPDCSNNC
jgi:aspartyl-tRNA synthetase